MKSLEKVVREIEQWDLALEDLLHADDTPIRVLDGPLRVCSVGNGVKREGSGVI